MMSGFFCAPCIEPNPSGSTARQFHAQAWQRYGIPLVLTCGQNNCRGDTQPTQSAEYSRSSYLYMVYPPPNVVRDGWGFFMVLGGGGWKMAVEKGGLVKLRFPEYPMFLLYLLKL